MKIALLGYGRMGKAIEKIAVERGHEIVIRKDLEPLTEDLSNADVAIDFSVPSAAVGNISNCLSSGVPVVSGTTGWLDDYKNMVALCEAHDGAFLYASNFSLGVNIFFELNKVLANMMNSLSQYSLSLEEIHHTQKVDAPSGTAISLAEGIMEKTRYKGWALGRAPESDIIPIASRRIDNIPGTHTINYMSEADTITMTHTAHSREGFALGAVIAAEWLVDKKGVYTMKDVLNIG